MAMIVAILQDGITHDITRIVKPKSYSCAPHSTVPPGLQNLSLHPGFMYGCDMWPINKMTTFLELLNSKELRTKWAKVSLQPIKSFDILIFGILDIPQKHIYYVHKYGSWGTPYPVMCLKTFIEWNRSLFNNKKTGIWSVHALLFDEKPPQN